MKDILLFVLKNCPYCVAALRMQNGLISENSRYQKIKIEKIDEGERPDFAGTFDYYYVPTYYVGGKKMHEGAVTKEKIKEVLEEALN